jgi:hypothetical protein
MLRRLEDAEGRTRALLEKEADAPRAPAKRESGTDG